MKPYRLNDVLEVNKSADWYSINIPEVPLIFSDNLLVDHSKIREILIDAPASSMKNRYGGNFIDYYDCRQYLGNENVDFHDEIRNKIFQYFGIRTGLLGDTYTNWFLQKTQRSSDISIPHTDHVQENAQFTILTFLNNEDECCGGTAFYRHKKSGRISLKNNEKMDFFTNYPHLIEDGVNYWVTKYLQEWDMLGYVEMKPGRVVVYPSEIFHGAYHTKDIYYDIPRLTMVYAEVQRI